MKPLVIYHAECTDGFAAAFAAWLKIGDEAEYLPMHYGFKEVPDFKEREVYILDFSWPRNLMDDLFLGARRVVWLDHHVSSRSYAEEKCGGYIGARTERHTEIRTIVHDNDQSGAMLAWRFFHPDTEVPMLIRHIDDRDRWQFKLEGSKEIHAALRSRPFEFGAWKRIYFEPGYEQNAINYSYSEGAAVLRAQDAHVQAMLKQARKCEIRKYVGTLQHHAGDQDVFAVARHGLALNTPMHISEVGNELANQSGTYGLVWYVGGDSRVKCSLRSNGDYDVSAIAKALGGGGHKNAARFKTDIETLMGWLR